MSESRRQTKDRSTAQEWERRIAAWERSGLDAEAFVDRDAGKYTVRTLKWWRSELRRRERRQQHEPTTPPLPIPLLRVQVDRPRPAATDATSLEIVVGGAVVRVPATADVRRVAELVIALTEATS